MTIVQVLLAIFLPPIAVLLQRGLGMQLRLNIVLSRLRRGELERQAVRQ